MTITYSLDVANTRFCGFTKLLLRWKGSIYKILWKELLFFTIGYTALSVTYRLYLREEQKRVFEEVTIYCETFIDLIPLSFVLGFYVSLVVGRWWSQFDAIPWPDRTSYKIAAYVHGSDERSRTIRRTLGRYLILLQMFSFQAVSTAVKKRFPTVDHIQAAGLLTKEERVIYEKIEVPYGKWWLPAHWFCALAMRARKEGRIKDSILLEGLLQEMMAFRSACGTMFNYDWISVPLVYTQVVTLVTYTYSIALLMGRQYLDPAQGYANHQIDLYVPVFTLLQFFFYAGWLKVAEQIVNPYGEDDDDFELNWCLDRSVQVVYLLVDHLHTKHPKLRRDHFWDDFEPQLPHTKLTVNNITNPQLGSAYNLEFRPSETEFLPLETLLEEDSEANIYSSDSMKHGTGLRYRPSILLNMINAGLRHSTRSRSIPKKDNFGDALSNSVRGHDNPVFNVNLETLVNNAGSPSHSRSSSVVTKPCSPTPSRTSSMVNRAQSPVPSRTSSLVNRAQSPAHSRTSSFSFRPPSVGRHRHKLYDLQLHQTEGFVQNGVLPDGDSGGVTPVSVTPTMSLPCNFDETSTPPIVLTDKEDQNSTEQEQIPSKLGESHMPPIPEEPSRLSCSPDLDMRDSHCSHCLTPLDEVQGLVSEANKVLEELNRAVTERGHRSGCELKGYESCCSLSDSSSEETEEEEVVNDINKKDFASISMELN